LATKDGRHRWRQAAARLRSAKKRASHDRARRRLDRFGEIA
jgi:hypothetical protein